MLFFRASRRVRAPGTPVFFIRSRPLFIRLPVLAPRGMQEFLFRGTFVSHGLSA